VNIKQQYINVAGAVVAVVVTTTTNTTTIQLTVLTIEPMSQVFVCCLSSRYCGIKVQYYF